MFHSSLERASHGRSVDITWKAFELRPREIRVSPEEEAAKEEYIRQTWPQVQQMARDVYGLHMERGPRVDTRTAHVGTRVAREFGKADPYVLGVFRAYWEQGKDIGDPAVLQTVAEAVGIPGDRFRAGLNDERYLRDVMEEQAESRLLGVRGVPATLINREHLLSGCRPASDMERIFRVLETTADRRE